MEDLKWEKKLYVIEEGIIEYKYPDYIAKLTNYKFVLGNLEYARMYYKERLMHVFGKRYIKFYYYDEYDDIHLIALNLGSSISNRFYNEVKELNLIGGVDY